MPSNVYSDNGTNFVGAANELKQIQTALRDAESTIRQHTTNNSIQWHFIPPRTPHMGGLWEATVHSMKRIMRKILPSHILKLDELSSILIVIEAVLNLRPLIQLEATDPNSPVLTPGHFLVGQPLLAPPTPTQSRQKISSLRRWHLVQRLTQDFWQQWRTAYLQSIQRKTKWRVQAKPFKAGDIVFLRENTFSYRQWPLARIVQEIPGDDEVVRVVRVLCQGKEYERAMVHIIPFISDETANDEDHGTDDHSARSSPRPPQSV